MDEEDLGKKGEKIVYEYLKGQGYEILDRNFRTPFGELDIVAEKNGKYIFVEVRSRKRPVYIAPEDSVRPQKQRHLIVAAKIYLQQHRLADVPWQIDLVAVEFDGFGNSELRHLEDAVEDSE